MKRIKSVNGYTIYQSVTARDEENYGCSVGSYNIYLSSDIRDYGLSYSYAEYDDIETLAEAINICNGSQFAIAAALAEEISGSTAQDMELVLAIEARLDAGEALNDIRADYLKDDEYWADMAAIEEDLGLRDDSDDELDDMDLEDQFDALLESGDRADANLDYDHAETDKLNDCMCLSGYHYDGLASDGFLCFHDNYGGSVRFDSWPEVREWLDGVCFDDPDVSDAVERILHPEHFAALDELHARLDAEQEVDIAALAAAAQHSDAEERDALMDFELSGLEPGDYLMSPSGDGIVRILSIDRSGTYPSFSVEYPNGTGTHLGAWHANRMTGVSKDSSRELREKAAALWASQAPKPCDLLDEPEYTHVEPLSRDRKADLFDHLLSRLIDLEYEDGDLIDTLLGLSFTDDEVRSVCDGMYYPHELNARLAPIGLDRGGATPRHIEYSDGSEGVEYPRWRVIYDGKVFPYDYAESITREYWNDDKARALYDYCEEHNIPVWLKDTFYDVTLHDGEWN